MSNKKHLLIAKIPGSALEGAGTDTAVTKGPMRGRMVERETQPSLTVVRFVMPWRNASAQPRWWSMHHSSIEECGTRAVYNSKFPRPFVSFPDRIKSAHFFLFLLVSVAVDYEQTLCVTSMYASNGWWAVGGAQVGAASRPTDNEQSHRISRVLRFHQLGSRRGSLAGLAGLANVDTRLNPIYPRIFLSLSRKPPPHSPLCFLASDNLGFLSSTILIT